MELPGRRTLILNHKERQRAPFAPLRDSHRFGCGRAALESLRLKSYFRFAVDRVYRQTAQIRRIQPMRKPTPPIGVIAPSQRMSVMLST